MQVYRRNVQDEIEQENYWIGLVAVAVVGLAACARGGRGGSAADSKVRAAIVTDSAGVDDKSFNQSAWEGLQAWGKANKLEKDSGYTYFQSNSESDFATNLSSAVRPKFIILSLVLVLDFTMLFQNQLKIMRKLITLSSMT